MISYKKELRVYLHYDRTVPNQNLGPGNLCPSAYNL